jgi:hypothetical protein
MDHLMEDGVFDEGFGQVETGIDTENEVIIGPGAKEPFAMFGKSEFSEESAGVGQFNGNRRERTRKEAGVELVKAGLDIGDGGDQFKISNLRFKN